MGGFEPPKPPSRYATAKTSPLPSAVHIWSSAPESQLFFTLDFHTQTIRTAVPTCTVIKYSHITNSRVDSTPSNLDSVQCQKIFVKPISALELINQELPHLTWWPNKATKWPNKLNPSYNPVPTCLVSTLTPFDQIWQDHRVVRLDHVLTAQFHPRLVAQFFFTLYLCDPILEPQILH